MTEERPPLNSFTADCLNLTRGLLMGGADAIPGVSGGTIALILRIYTRLVTAVSHFDVVLLGYLARFQWRRAAEHVDLRFLVSLACGIVLGLVVTLRCMGELLTNPQIRPFTLAAFFGMILASCVLVAQMVRPASLSDVALKILLGALGAAAAFAVYWFTTFGEGLSVTQKPSFVYLFCCGAIAICAMILPGISGAMMLLLLGVYVYLAEIPRHLLNGEQVATSLMTVAVFGSGCAFGLVLFSKILRRMLTRYPSMTMAVLCGFMFGSLPKLWPFDVRVEGSVESLPNYLPTLPTVGAAVLGVLVVAGVAMVFVFIVDWLARPRTTPTASSASGVFGARESEG